MVEARQDRIGAVALLSEPTRRRLYEFVIASPEAVGRDDAAAGTGVSRELAAFHLDRLADAGLLETEYRRRNGRSGPGAGRPAKLYRRATTDLAVSIPARDYEGMAAMLAEAMERLDAGPALAALTDVAREHGRRIATDARDARGRGTGASGDIADLVALLDDGGFEPWADTETGAVCLRNCPYRTLSAHHRDLICGMNLAWADGVVRGLEVEDVEARLLPQPDRCCVVFEREPDGLDRSA